MNLPPIAAPAATRPMSLDDLARYVRPLLVRLAERPAPMDGEYEECHLCDVTVPWRKVAGPAGLLGSDQYHYDQRAHLEDCPWRQARELLGIPLNRIEAHERERIGSDLPEAWEFPS